MKFTFGEREHDVYLEEKSGNHYRIRIDRHVLHVWGATDRSEVLLDIDGHLYNFRRPDILDERYMEQGREDSAAHRGNILAPLNGRIVQISSKEGDEIRKGEALLVIESMKMENKVLAPIQAMLKKIHVSVGEQVHTNQLLFTLDSNDSSPDK